MFYRDICEQSLDVMINYGLIIDVYLMLFYEVF